MIADQQRRLRRQPLPTGYLQPEIVLTQEIPHRLLSAHQLLVGTVKRVLGRGRDTLGDQSLDPTLGWALGIPGLRRARRLERRSAVALGRGRDAPRTPA